mmetsp:Transcript_19904/g.64795  ORF Transcript_19904/g.64795 Transcript_19904/m.64795 type:complete len:388 (+) Transcript_19904:103-1266(+)
MPPRKKQRRQEPQAPAPAPVPTASSALLSAAQRGDAEAVKAELAAAGAEPNVKNTEKGRTALHLAAQEGHLAVVELLLADERVDPNPRDDIGVTPLMFAAQEGHSTLALRLLQDARTHPGLETPKSSALARWTALFVAAKAGLTEVVEKMLADHRVKPNTVNEEGDTALSVAASLGHLAVVELFLADQRVKPNVANKQGCTALMYAASGGHVAVVERMLAEERVDPNQTVPQPLKLGFGFRQAETASAASQLSYTALLFACSTKAYDVVKLMLASKRVDPGAFTNYSTQGVDALLMLARDGHAALVTTILKDKRVDPNRGPTFGRIKDLTPLQIAAGNGHCDVVRALLADKRVDVLKRGADNETALESARIGNQSETAQLIWNHQNC